jgi:hypothetical protein
MNEMTKLGDKRMTLRQVAQATGASYRTVAAYAQKAGWTENGKLTLLTEEQATIIVEAMKDSDTGAAMHRRGKTTLRNVMQAEKTPTFHNAIEGIETEFSDILQIKLLDEEQRRLQERKEALYKKRITTLEAENVGLQQLLDARTAGLETIQRIAEAGGLVMSDRDDIEATYRRGR